MRRKLLLPILIICFGILSFCGISVSAGTYEDLTYTVSNGKVTITSCALTATEVVIPQIIEDCPVTSIGSWAFENCKSLSDITIPDGVTSIGYGAFSSCPSLTSITIPDGVTSIGYEAFYNCSSLTSVTIPDSVTSIGGWAFAGCTSLKRVNITDISTWCNIDFGSANANPLYHGSELYLNNNIVTDLVIPDGVTSIGMDAFYNCKSLVSVTIPDSVTSIGASAFSDCPSLTSITIPDSVTYIGGHVFYNCTNITKVNITDISAWCNIDFANSYANPLCYAENLYLNDELVTNLVIPDGVTSIGMDAFYSCTSLVSVTIPDSVTYIGHYAFENCSSLTSITIPDSVTSIGSWAFAGCTSLTKVNITDISSWCNIDFGSADANPLYNGANLYLNDGLVTDLVIPQEIKNIKANTFYNCKSLKSVKLHENISNIYSSAFYNCTNLEDIYIEKGLSVIVTNAFYNCSSVDNVYYSGSEEDWDAIVIGGGNDCLENKDIITFGVVIQKTYTFITNGGSAVSDIEGEILECPVTTRENYEFMGWYDNSEFSGNPVTFPYSCKKTTLYARWKPIIHTNTTLLDKTPDYDIYTVVPTNIPVGSEIIFACYYKNELTYVETRTYEGENPLYFVEHSVGEYDEVKIMVWENLDGLKPVCDFESVDL